MMKIDEHWQSWKRKALKRLFYGEKRYKRNGDFIQCRRRCRQTKALIAQSNNHQYTPIKVSQTLFIEIQGIRDLPDAVRRFR